MHHSGWYMLDWDEARVFLYTVRAWYVPLHCNSSFFFHFIFSQLSVNVWSSYNPSTVDTSICLHKAWKVQRGLRSHMGKTEMSRVYPIFSVTLFCSFCLACKWKHVWAWKLLVVFYSQVCWLFTLRMSSPVSQDFQGIHTILVKVSQSFLKFWV